MCYFSTYSGDLMYIDAKALTARWVYIIIIILISICFADKRTQ